METPMYGLLLVGGKSQRMGSDKALLQYGGEQTQLERATELLNTVCGKVFVSQRHEQAFPTPQDTEAIYDSIEDVKGPLCGILSAMQAHPEAHWLVLACDMPNLTQSTLKKLIGAFQSAPPQLTAYCSGHDGLPEPLCAIYPCGSNVELLALAEDLRTSSPRKLLIARKARLLTAADPRSLDNINTVEEFKALKQK